MARGLARRLDLRLHSPDPAGLGVEPAAETLADDVEALGQGATLVVEWPLEPDGEVRAPGDLVVVLAAGPGPLPPEGTVVLDAGLTVEELVEGAAAAVAGAVRGEELAAERSRMRRRENVAAAAQLRAWWQDAGDDAPEPPVFPFSCECGRSGCEDDVPLPLPVWAIRCQTGAVVAPGHA